MSINAQYESRLIEYNIPKCKQCGNSHKYQLEIRYKAANNETSEVVVFGGKGGPSRRTITNAVSSTNSPVSWDVVFLCPEMNQSFVMPITIEVSQDKEEIVGIVAMNPSTQSVSSADDVLQMNTSTEKAGLSNDVMNKEFEEWVSSSAASAREFCKTMLTISTGAVPIFFTVLKYIGVEQASTPRLAWFGICPPSLFLISSILFIFALRPQYSTIASLLAFEKFRKERLQKMNRYIRIGVGVFILAVFLAILIFVGILSSF